MAIPVRLKVFKGDVLVASRDFERDIIKIGRLASAHLCLEDEKVSRIHSVIEVGADGSLSITDMGSVGGTHVNGKRVSKGRLTFGDEVLVGGTTLRLERPTEVAARNLASAVESAEPVVTPTPAASPEVPPSAPPIQAAPVPVQVPSSAVAPVEEAPRVRRVASPKARGPLGVSLRFLWGDQNVGEFFAAPGARKGFSVGTAEGVDFVMGDARLGAPRLEVLRTDGQGFSVGFTGRMKGGLTRKGETLDLQAVIESGLASHEDEAYALPLETEDFLWVDLGGVTLEVCFQPVPRRAAAPLGDSVDFTVVNVFLVTFFLAAFFVISAVNQGADEVAYTDELSSNTSRIAKLIVKPPEVKQNRLLQQLDERKREQEVRREVSKPHKRDNAVTDRTVAPRHEPRHPSKTQRGGAAGARELVRGLFSGGSTANLFQGPGGKLAGALGNVGSTRTSSNGSLGMLGLRGGPSGGGGSETVGLIGSGGVRGRSSGESDYGSGAEKLGGKQSASVSIVTEEVQVSTPIDRELIRKVIQLNRSQVRYCYESQLNRHPSLVGKVAVRFVISAEGVVASSEVAQATTDNPELEQCVASRVRGWLFPKPKGGGSVVVTYPFLFKPAGDN